MRACRDDGSAPLQEDRNAAQRFPPLGRVDRAGLADGKGGGTADNAGKADGGPIGPARGCSGGPVAADHWKSLFSQSKGAGSGLAGAGCALTRRLRGSPGAGALAGSFLSSAGLTTAGQVIVKGNTIKVEVVLFAARAHDLGDAWVREHTRAGVNGSPTARWQFNPAPGWPAAPRATPSCVP